MSNYPVAPVFPTNQSGEVVVESGTSDVVVTGFLSENLLPINPATGAIVLAGLSGVVINASTSRDLVASDNGKVLYSASASAITLNLTSSLPVGFGCAIIQNAAGQVTVSAGAGTTLHNVSSFTKTSGQYATIALIQTTPNNYILVGSGA